MNVGSGGLDGNMTVLDYNNGIARMVAGSSKVGSNEYLVILAARSLSNWACAFFFSMVVS